MPEIYGQNTESVPFWEEEAAKYRDDLDTARAPYHAGRLATARRLFEGARLAPAARVIDFGCGDGVFGHRLAAEGYSVLGFDPAAAMIELANAKAGDGATFEVGGAEALLDAGPCDAIVALNVLAYMTDAEMETFWRAVQKVLRPGGVFLVSHSNELFDMFALNAGTSRFFERHFTGGRSVASLLTDAEQEQRSYNVRANPLTYGEELARVGLRQEAQAFFNFHPLPPALLGPPDDGRVVDPDEIARVPLWKQHFQCSTFFALARRAEHSAPDAPTA
jgi:2-polyprenyl-3-methyl-5-hydroxy-6-metoxy-1,4-benzoquinol methylase